MSEVAFGHELSSALVGFGVGCRRTDQPDFGLQRLVHRRRPDQMNLALSAELKFTLVWEDSDLHEVVVYVSSKHFSGETSLYVSPGDLANLADQLSGFPTSRQDQRQFELGQRELSGYGEVRGVIYCRDSTGHVGVHISVRHAPEEPSDKPESCAVLLHVVPSDLDRFVEELRALTQEGQEAILKNAA